MKSQVMKKEKGDRGPHNHWRRIGWNEVLDRVASKVVQNVPDECVCSERAEHSDLMPSITQDVEQAVDHE